MKIYIAGAITGIEDYKERFTQAERLLKWKDRTTLNPAILPEGFAHEEYMKICLPMVEVCDAIIMLPGWQESPGANMEHAHAVQKGKDRYYAMEDVPEVGL